MARVPDTVSHYLIPRRVLEESQALLREPGRHGYEATVVWVGSVVDEVTAEVVAAVMPLQRAYRGPLGCSVEVPAESISELISALPAKMFVLARLHTHPTVAYHSELDDTNMLIGHRGAISIVVPFFARDPLELDTASVNELRDVGWVELSPGEVADRFTVL